MAKKQYKTCIEMGQGVIRAFSWEQDILNPILFEKRGSFDQADDLQNAAEEVADHLAQLGHSVNTLVLSGRQLLFSQYKMSVGDDQMEKILRLELRKNVSFEVANAVLGWESEVIPDSENQLVSVSLVQSNLYHDQVNLWTNKGVKLSSVQIQPMALANILWTNCKEIFSYEVVMMIHLKHEGCWIVIEGGGNPVFTRFLPMDLSLFETADDAGEFQRLRLKSMLLDEIRRSLGFYTNNFPGIVPHSCLVAGEFTECAEVRQMLFADLNLQAVIIDGEYAKLDPKYWILAIASQTPLRVIA